MLKNSSTLKKNSVYAERISKFREKCSKIFEIASCKCSDFKRCSCAKSKKIPLEVRAFILDQRSERKHCTANVLKTKTFSAIQRVKETHKFACNEGASTSNADDVLLPSSTSSESYSEFSSPENTEKIKYNTMPFSNVASECARYEVSYTVGAAIASATLKDVGLITDTNKELVIDRNKIKGCKDKLAKDIDNPNLMCLTG